MPSIKGLRERRNLTQKELADLVGVSLTTIRNWENGRSGTEWFQRVGKLCSTLGCAPEQLVGDADVKQDK